MTPDAQRYDSFSEIEAARERNIEAFAGQHDLTPEERDMVAWMTGRVIEDYTDHVLGDSTADAQAELRRARKQADIAIELTDGEAA